MGDKKGQTPQDQLLAKILDECMEEELSFVPTEREIARMHTFSSEFQERMAELLRTRGKPAGRRMEKREFIYGFNKVAACILALLVVGGLGFAGFHVLGPENSKSIQEEAVEGTDAAAAVESSEVTADESEAALEEAAPADEKPQEAETGAGQEKGENAPSSGKIPPVEFLGEELKAAPEQELLAESGKVKTLVNSPMIARDAKEVMLTIGNMEEYSVFYYQQMELEVLINGYWYVVPPLTEPTEEESRQMVELEPGMAQDETILLENYKLDPEAEGYRIVTYLDNMTLCAQFGFEDEELFQEEEEP